MRKGRPRLQLTFRSFSLEAMLRGGWGGGLAGQRSPRSLLEGPRWTAAP